MSRKRRPFNTPIKASVRGTPPKGNTAPWFMKSFGSRPANKRKQPAEPVAREEVE